jgi:hypothetical protein
MHPFLGFRVQHRLEVRGLEAHAVVALQGFKRQDVAAHNCVCEEQTLKQVSHLTRVRSTTFQGLKPGALELWVQLCSTAVHSCLHSCVQPRQDVRLVALLHVKQLLHLLLDLLEEAERGKKSKKMERERVGALRFKKEL